MSTDGSAAAASAAAAPVLAPKYPNLGPPLEPFGGLDQTPGEQIDVEHVPSVRLFPEGQQIEQERRQTGLSQLGSDIRVPRAVAAAPAPMGEDDDPGVVGWHCQVSTQPNRPEIDLDVLVDLTGTRSGAVEQLDDFVVGRLTELLAEPTDGEHAVDGLQSEILVSGIGHPFLPAVGRSQRCENDLGSAPTAGDRAGSSGRRSGGDAVVDDDRCPAEQFTGRPIPAQPCRPTIQLEPFARLGHLHVALAHAHGSAEPVVHDSDSAFSDRPDGHLGSRSDTELSDEDDVERCTEFDGHGCRDRYTATGHSEDDHVVPVRPRPEPRPQSKA